MYRLMMMCCLVGLANSATAQVCQTTIKVSAPDTRYQIVAGSQGAEVLDLYTNLIWQRCSVGQQWTGNTCEGTAQTYSWHDALKQSATQANPAWRVPNIRELQSLIEEACYDSSINPNIFPNTPAQVYWSSSPSVTKSGDAWSVDFDIGSSRGGTQKSGLFHMRLVRFVTTR